MKQMSKGHHDGITPNQAFGLIQGLKENNRGAEIFEKRRQNADRWVVDETNVKRAPPRPVSPTIHKMMTDMNRPLQENYAASVPAVAEVIAAPVPKPIDMSVDLNEIKDPIEILEMALQDKAAEEAPAPAAPAAPALPALPAPAPVATPTPIVAVPASPPAPAPAVITAIAPASTNPDLTSFMGQGPVGWK